MWKIVHRIAHILGWYKGEVVTWWQGDMLMVGFKCSSCGEITGHAKTPFKR